MRQLLARRGVDWPAAVHFVETVGSTNDWLRERAREAPEWTAVFAGCQTSGRGRQGRTWVSPAGNLFLSVLVRPRLPAEVALVMPLLVGVAVREALAEHGAEARLKWPNDLMAGERKLGGILAEGFSSGGGLTGLVVGIGLNVALDPASLPPDLREQVTSLRAQTGVAPAVEALAAAVLACTRGWYHALERDGPGPVLHAWRAASVPWWGRAVEARSGDALVRGIARDVDARGALVLETEDGSEVAVLGGEVRELRLGQR